MLYINLADSSIEIIQTNKNLIGGEKIIAVSRRDLPEGVISNGLISDSEKLAGSIKEALLSGYPKVIKDNSVSVAISDKQVFIKRMTILSDEEEKDMSSVVLNEAKKMLPYEPSELENFYKVLRKDASSSEVLYTATPLNTVAYFGRFFRNMGIQMRFISSTSFAIYELLKYGANTDGVVLYCSVDKKTIEYFIMDNLGPVLVLDKKLGSKSLVAEIKEVLKTLTEKYNLKAVKVIVGGTSSIEVHSQELNEGVEIPVVKTGEIIDEILFKAKVDFDTGGIPKMFFANSVGLLLLGKSSAPPNFAGDFKNYEGEVMPVTAMKIKEKVEPEKTSVKEEEEKVDKPEKPEEKREVSIKGETPDFGLANNIGSGQILEYKKSFFNQFFSSKIALLIIVVIILVVGGGVFFSLGKQKTNFSLPFLSSPTITPTPTVEPTVTPTPTVNPNLKRSDLKIQVQNGTDKTGYAKEIADFLTGKGYKNIAKGNADNTNYEKTVIKIKDSKKEYLPLVISDLKDKADTSTVEALEDSSKHDAVVILGQK